MPRQIIDTQSSRPAYVRRLTLTWVVVIAVAVVIAIAGYTIWRGHLPFTGSTRAAHVGFVPGNYWAQGNLAPVHIIRSIHAA